MAILYMDDVKNWLTFSFDINIWLAFVCEAPIMQAKRRRNGKPNNPAQAEGIFTTRDLRGSNFRNVVNNLTTW